MVPNPNRDLAPLVGNSKNADRSKQHPRSTSLGKRSYHDWRYMKSAGQASQWVNRLASSQ
jgi:hypothetical protein